MQLAIVIHNVTLAFLEVIHFHTLHTRSPNANIETHKNTAPKNSVTARKSALKPVEWKPRAAIVLCRQAA